MKSNTTTGKLILYPATLITASPKFQIAIHPVSKEIYKINSTFSNDGLIGLDSLRDSHKRKFEDTITSYLFPYIMTDAGDLYPIDLEWQKIFNIVEEKKVYDVTIEKVLGMGSFASKAERSRFYSLDITVDQVLKLTQTELDTMRTMLTGVDYKIKRIKR